MVFYSHFQKCHQLFCSCGLPSRRHLPARFIGAGPAVRPPIGGGSMAVAWLGALVGMLFELVVILVLLVVI